MFENYDEAIVSLYNHLNALEITEEETTMWTNFQTNWDASSDSLCETCESAYMVYYDYQLAINEGNGVDDFFAGVVEANGLAGE